MQSGVNGRTRRRSVAGWDQGDFNFDGVVNSLDALLMTRNYNAVLPAAVEAAAGPTTPPQIASTPTQAPPSNNTATDSIRDHGSKRHSKRHGR